jgi:hypothetical protein
VGRGFESLRRHQTKTKSLKTLAQCVAIGTVVTLALFGLGYVAASMGAETLSYVLYWQAYALYMLLPCDVVYNGEFMCESVAAARMTFYAGIPVGILVYSLAAWPVLWLRRRAAPSPA